MRARATCTGDIIVTATCSCGYNVTTTAPEPDDLFLEPWRIWTLLVLCLLAGVCFGVSIGAAL